MSVLSKIFTLRGRIDRVQYAVAWAAGWSAMLAPAFMFPADDMLIEVDVFSLQLIDAYWIATTVGAIIGLAVHVVAGWRRAHDLNMTGWIALGSLLIILALPLYVFFMARRGTRGPNRYGAEPASEAAAEA